MKKVNKGTLKRKADQAFAKFIRTRDGRCMLQGMDEIICSPQLQCMHLMSRRNMRLRYDEVNCITGCSAHHTYYTYHPEEWMFLIHDKFPLHFNYIVDHRSEIVKVNEEYFREVIKNYQQNV